MMQDHYFLAARRPRQMYSWYFVGTIIICLGGGLLVFSELLHQKQSKPHKVEAGGDALIGGDWEMINHKGNRVSNIDYKGKYLLIYFGFTFCPDVCPRELTKLAKAL